MNNFFSPLLHVYQNIDVNPNAYSAAGDMPFFHYLLFLTMRLDFKSLESLMQMRKKALQKTGEFDIFTELPSSFLDPNSLYMAKVISLMIERFESNICFVGKRK
jgi:hypothetical protein